MIVVANGKQIVCLGSLEFVDIMGNEATVFFWYARLLDRVIERFGFGFGVADGERRNHRMEIGLNSQLFQRLAKPGFTALGVREGYQSNALGL